MAAQINVKKEDVKPDPSVAVEVVKPNTLAAADAEVQVTQKIILELSPPIRRYTRGSGGTSKTYESEKAYRFTVAQAVILLAEVQEPTGIPIWRRYKPKIREAERVQTILTGHKPLYEADGDDIRVLPKPDEAVSQPMARLDIGDDAEAEALLNEAQNGPVVIEDGGITV